MRVTRNRFVRFSLASLVVLLVGCSTKDTFEQPVPVPEIDASVEFKRIWTMSVGKGHDDQFLHLAPLYAGDVIYAASADGLLVAVEPGNGKALWQRRSKDRIFAGFGGDGNQLYYITRDAELVALSRETSDELWRASLPTEGLAAPQSNGSLVVAQTTDGRVIGFDAANGERLWQYDGQVPVLSMRTAAAPLVGGDIVIASFANGRVIALTADAGQPVWQYEVGQPQGRTELERLVDIGGQPLVLESAIMVAGYQGKLALVDIRSGQEIWSRRASSFYSPSIGGGSIFLAAANGDIIAYRGSDRRELWVQDRLSWRQVTRPVASGDYVVTGDYEGYLHALSREDGALQGQLKFDSDGIRVPVQVIEDGNLLVYGNGGRMAVYSLKPKK
ncbi:MULTISPECIES: outer membrane protein assembly factor BamB [Marinobacter]|jgi:outer membrane protein assembly factor BamB|uniref:outer membrane protein assembly factor BamB n=1 Tax=Marinobacter TaxID=2742 RepID=UPI00257341BD|nr:MULTISPECIES: outer membrane protein assembly factor BamB [Marinobacter]MDX5440235.1 outer membrane protein assembly factor BamB [Alteromonadaceae bacterium]WBU39627.1 outer membrane protein assembly factor BamB [Marinobacter alkaliphilus]MDX5336437.1 outer membrane protein assembly factor BamB [Marinobacter sp.]MDX5387546.1 outer membrane protein assembly factor BamB [Marinobacter sp.]MDX5472881.1 outer membrane protein assembly factor BamB [Marinobacter sp.]